MPDPGQGNAGNITPGGDEDPGQPGYDTGVPHSARVYNYWLGGEDNFAADTLNLGQPTAIMMIGILHLIKDADDPAGMIRQLLAGVPSRSWLAIAHPASDMAEDQTSAMTDTYNRRVTTAATLRTRDQIAAFFGGLDLLSPGVVPLNRWRPGVPDSGTSAAADDVAAYCALGRKP